MTAECAKIKYGWFSGSEHQQKPSDIFAELSGESYQIAYGLALRDRLDNLESRLKVLENQAQEARIKHSKVVLRELVKEARAKILEVNGIPPPSSKQSWKFRLNNLTPQQLQQAKVNLKMWPEIIEVLSPSTVKLNGWVNRCATWQAARIIESMDTKVKATWVELFKLTHQGVSCDDYSKMERPPME